MQDARLLFYRSHELAAILCFTNNNARELAPYFMHEIKFPLYSQLMQSDNGYSTYLQIKLCNSGTVTVILYKELQQ